MDTESRHDWKIKRLEQRVTAREVPLEVLLDLAEAYFQKGYYYGGGEQWFTQTTRTAGEAIARFGGSARAYNLLANAAFALGETDEARTHYEAALDVDPGDALAQVGLGNLHKNRGSLGPAVSAFEKAVANDPNLWQAHYNLGGALFAEARERDFKAADEAMEQAIYHLVTALRLEPFPSFLGNIYKDLGELFLHTRQYKYARRFFTRLLNHPEFDAIAHYYLGLTHFSMGRYNNAIHHYRQFLQGEPDSALAWSKIGLAHLELGEWDKARDACQEALQVEPGNVLARFSLGCVDLDQRRFDEAEARFSRLLDENAEYFPAYVELVKSHYLRGDFGWLFEQLKAEIDGFEREQSFDGGRQFYKGRRGRRRRRIDVLLAQVQEVGVDAFSSLAEIVEAVQTDSLRFQMWEQLYDLSRRHKVEQLLEQLEAPGDHFGAQLGRTVLLLSQYVPEEAITDAFHIDEEDLKRRAQRNKGPGDDLTAYLEALEEVRSELRQFQAYLLLALAVKGTPSAEDFLTDYVDSEHGELSASASLALLFYGSDQAIGKLRAEAERLGEPHASRLQELIDLGIDRSDTHDKVIDLAEAAQQREHRSRRATGESCSVCSREKSQVDRLMSGNRVYICNLCVSYVHGHRQQQLAADREGHSCSFCSASTFEVEALYTANKLLICNRCLDTCVRLLAREEVDRFLKSFQ